MAETTNWDAANPEHFALMAETDVDLLLRGMKPAELEALRKAQYEAPPARSSEEVKQARQEQARSSKREERKAE